MQFPSESNFCSSIHRCSIRQSSWRKLYANRADGKLWRIHRTLDSVRQVVAQCCYAAQCCHTLSRLPCVCVCDVRRAVTRRDRAVPSRTGRAKIADKPICHSDLAGKTRGGLCVRDVSRCARRRQMLLYRRGDGGRRLRATCRVRHRAGCVCARVATPCRAAYANRHGTYAGVRAGDFRRAVCAAFVLRAACAFSSRCPAPACFLI